MASNLETVRAWLAQADFPAIVAYARKHKRVLSTLTALTYDPDNTLSWRAVEAIGLAAAQIAEIDSEYVRVHLRRLAWLLNDESGGIGWRAPECMGEIVYHCPTLFRDFLPILVNLIDMEPDDAPPFRAGWLWAMGRLAAVCPEQVRAALPWIQDFLDDRDPQVCGLAVWCLGRVAHRLPTCQVSRLQADTRPVRLYISPDVRVFRIADLAQVLSD